MLTLPVVVSEPTFWNVSHLPDASALLSAVHNRDFLEMPSLESRQQDGRRVVDDFVVAKASKNPTDQQISIQADHPDFTRGKAPNIFQVFDGTLGLGPEGWVRSLGRNT